MSAAAASGALRRRISDPRPRRREGDGTGRVAKYPASPWRRWLLRFGLASPFTAMVLLLDAGSGDYFRTGTANAALSRAGAEILAEPLSVEAIGLLYPPIATLLAVVVPGGVVGLGIAGSLAAGYLLQRLIEWFVRQRLRGVDVAILTLAVAATPPFAFLVTTNLEVSLGLVLFAIAMVDLVRFVVFANTQAGFRAGLLFAAAALTAPAFLFSIAVAACVAPFLPHSRYGSRVAVAFILAFPTLAAFGSVSLLGLVFLADPLLATGGVDLGIVQDRLSVVQAVLSPPWGWLYFLPAAVGTVLAFALRRPATAIVPLLLTASMLLMALVGVLPAGSSGTAFMLLVLVAAAIVPRRPRGRRAWLIRVLAASQIATGWVAALLIYDPVALWAQALREGWPL